MKKISLIFIFLYALNSFSQNELQTELNIGYAFQNEIELVDHELENAGGFSSRFGINYLVKINEQFYLETGMYGKYNRGQKSISTLNFTFNSLRGQVPLYVGYNNNERWRFSVGASLENNKDLDEIDINNDHNLRYDLLTKLVYLYKDKLQYSLYTNWMVSSSPDVFTISSPRNGVYFGVIYSLRKKVKAEKDE